MPTGGQSRASRAARKPVMFDVARRAGVSQKTVSRVVNNEPHVRETVRARVQQAIDELGYRPNATARALVRQRSSVVGIVAPGIALYGPTAQLFGLERAAREAGYGVVIVTTADDSQADLEAAVLRLVNLGAEGLILGGPLADSRLPAGTFHGVPFVTVGDPLPALADHAWVAFDQPAGAQQATEHLLELGHRTVWHVAGPDSWYSARARRAGWERALDAAGAQIPEPLIGDWTAASGYAAGLLLADRPDVTAVFAANDHMAVGLLRACHERGRAVPGDVSVVGFDDAPDSEFATVPLTTIRQDFTVISQAALAALLTVMNGGPVSQDVTCLPVHLVVRGSAGRCALTALERAPPATPRASDRTNRPQRRMTSHPN